MVGLPIISTKLELLCINPQKKTKAKLIINPNLYFLKRKQNVLKNIKKIICTIGMVNSVVAEKFISSIIISLRV